MKKELLEERKQIVYELICDDLYVPMKAKEIARTIVQIVFIILSIIMTVIVLMQEGKNNGLGALTGSSDTYWSKNKGRSMEGMLVKITRVLLALFLIISAVLTIGRFQ